MSQSFDDERAPLLTEAVDVERQPQRSQSQVAKLPIRGIVLLNLLNAMQPLVFELVFPFVNQMLFEAGVVTDEARVGYFSGLIESCYAAMSFLAILPCCYVSDRFGRKPVILLGILGLAVSTCFFGVSRTFPAMIVSRCIAGTMGGTYSAIKIMLGEMTPQSSQGVAFSLLTISYRTGQMLGLPIGGFLAHPERTFPGFDGPFWKMYPFALPCFVAAGVGTVGVVLGCFFLPETLPSGLKVRRKQTAEFYSGALQSDSELQAEGHYHAAARKMATKSVLTPNIILILSHNTAMCLVSEMLFSLYPLFAFTPVEAGGLGIREDQIGMHLAMRSLMPIPMMLLFPSIQRRIGTVRLYQIVLFAFPLVIVLFPVLNCLVYRGVSGWIYNATLFGYFVTWSWSGFAWTCQAIMANDASPHPDMLATVNSLHQMTTSLTQAIAPALATAMFATSISSKILGGQVIWVILLLFSFLIAFHAFDSAGTTTGRKMQLGIFRVSHIDFSHLTICYHSLTLLSVLVCFTYCH